MPVQVAKELKRSSSRVRSKLKNKLKTQERKKNAKSKTKGQSPKATEEVQQERLPFQDEEFWPEQKSSSKEEELQVVQKIPDDMQVKVNKVVSKYSHKPDFMTSLSFVLRDLVYATLVVIITFALQQYVHWSVLFPLYSVVMGTVLTGFWVLGHECGHGAFGATTNQNDVVGFIIHSLLLVPYFSWQYSHKKHHKYTNHLTLGETHVPQTKEEYKSSIDLHEMIGDDAFTIVNVFFPSCFRVASIFICKLHWWTYPS